MMHCGGIAEYSSRKGIESTSPGSQCLDFNEIIIESKDKILNNKEIMLEYYDKIISETYNFILDSV